MSTKFGELHYSVFSSTIDFGLLAEWNYDKRQGRTTNIFNNDIFLATRLALNDIQSTEIVASILVDTKYYARTMALKLNRRLSGQWSLRLEGIFIFAIDEMDLIHYETRSDSFIELSASYNF